MVKKIRIWKIVLLTIVTLGIYNMVWLARRRNEMVKKGKFKVPHWLWLVIPLLLTCAAAIPLISGVYGLTGSHEQMIELVFAYLSAAVIIYFVISVWWFYQFGKASTVLTDGKVTTGWTVAYWILVSFLIVPVLQYYFNRAPKSSNAKSKPKHRPTRKFVILSLVVFILGAACNGGLLYLSYTDPEWGKDRAEAVDLDVKGEKLDELSRNYTECTDELDKKYPQPEVDEAKYEQYQKDYKKCDVIYADLEEAIKQYDAAYEKW